MVSNWPPVVDKVLETGRSAGGVLANPPNGTLSDHKKVNIAGRLPSLLAIEPSKSEYCTAFTITYRYQDIKK